jgi:hypothetical protein
MAAGGDAHAPEGAVEPYLSPPRPDHVQRGASGLLLSGTGPPRSKARLATPQGQSITGNVDKQGRWAMALGPASVPQVFGLSVALDDRTVQAEGYVLATPSGQVALLRAGGASMRIDRPPGFGFRLIDFDRGGGMAVSAAVAPGATVILRLDGRQVAQGRADATGLYVVDLPAAGAPSAIAPGLHRLQMYGDGFSDNITLQLVAAAPLVQGPMRSQLTGAGLRVDWMTPGGGVQSTILVH